MQLEHLREYPFVRNALTEGKLRIHRWIYDVFTGEIRVLEQD